MGAGLGSCYYQLAGKRRRLALENLRLSLGDQLTAEEIRRVAKASFANHGRGLAELFRFPLLDSTGLLALFQIDGEEHLQEALAQGKGVMLLGAHLGNFDLGAPLLAAMGYPMALISKVPTVRAASRWWMGSRERKGLRIFAGEGILKDTLRFLRQGGVVAFVLDQNAVHKSGVFVPFFGRPASTLSTLAVLARRTGAPVVPAHTFREGQGHRLVIEPAFVARPNPDKEAEIFERTKSYVEWTEKVVRRHPEQWTWLHDRWKTQGVHPDAKQRAAHRRISEF